MAKLPQKYTAPAPPSLAPQGLKTQRVIQTPVSKHLIAMEVRQEPKDIGELAVQMRRDYQVRLAEIVLQAKVRSISVAVTSNSQDPRALGLANELTKLWNESLHDIFEAFSMGRQAFEKVWHYDPRLQVRFIRKLDPLPYMQTEMVLQDGTFAGVKFKAGRDTTVIPPEQCWWLAYNPTPVEPHGHSGFMGAPHSVWKERQEALRLRRVFIKKLVLQGGVAHIPDRAELENGQILDTYSLMAQAHDERLSGGVMLLPNIRDKASGQYEYDYTETPSVLDPAPLDTHIDGLDQEQLQAFGVPPKTILEGAQVGSYALVTQQMEVLNAVVEHILCQFERSFQEFVVEKVLADNFDPGSGVTLTVGHKSLLSYQNPALSTIVGSLLTLPEVPQIVSAGIVDIERMLTSVGIPLTPDVKELIQKMLDQASRQQKAEEQAQQAALQQVQAQGQGGTPEAPGGAAAQSQPPSPQSATEPDQSSTALAHDLDSEIAMLAGRSTSDLVSAARKLITRPFNALEHPRAARGRFANKGGGSKPIPKPRSQARVDNLSTSDIAKKSAVRTGVAEQRYAEDVCEPELADMIGGHHIPGNHAVDVLVEGDHKKVHGIELKVITKSDKVRSYVNARASALKSAWMKKPVSIPKHGHMTAGRKGVVHMVYFDDRNVKSRPTKRPRGKRDTTGRVIYYKRGYGGFRHGSMYRVKDAAELKRLIRMPDHQLPPKALYKPRGK